MSWSLLGVSWWTGETRSGQHDVGDDAHGPRELQRESIDTWLGFIGPCTIEIPRYHGGDKESKTSQAGSAAGRPAK